MERTHRQKLVELIRDSAITLHQISGEIRLPIKEVLHHLEHVRKSTRPPMRFVLEPALCLKCGFIFKDRRKLSPPSRCPKCKDSHLQDPRYGIVDL